MTRKVTIMKIVITIINNSNNKNSVYLCTKLSVLS